MIFQLALLVFGCTLVVPVSSFTSPSLQSPTHLLSTKLHMTVDLQELEDLGFPLGLRESLLEASQAVAKRFWIIDNSGSMTMDDGQRVVTDKNTGISKMVPCTRWKEVQETIEYHAALAACLEAPTEFRVLNPRFLGPNQVTVSGKQDLDTARKYIRKTEPTGATPLTRCVESIKDNIQKMSLQPGQTVSVSIVTDGLPTDENGYGGDEANSAFGKALESLNHLPVSIVIRLCTDSDHVVDFYNYLDGKLELQMDVLDDFQSEAKEVARVNRWLNYGLPIHRVREMGSPFRLFDLLDERKLTLDEMRDFCALVHGEAMMDGMPDPNVDRAGFRKSLSYLDGNTVWNPISSTIEPWITGKFIPNR